MKLILLGALLLTGCTNSRDRIGRVDNTVGKVTVLVNECHDSQCYQLIEIDEYRCIAQYRGGMHCFKGDRR